MQHSKARPANFSARKPASPIHPLGEMTLIRTARRGEPDWRIMSGNVGVGDWDRRAEGIRRMTPQRLDNLSGKILAYRSETCEHTASSTVSANGRYRILNDNPFTAIEVGARRKIWAVGLRNPHRLVWDVDPAAPRSPRLFAFNIGLTHWETVMIDRKARQTTGPLA